MTDIIILSRKTAVWLLVGPLLCSIWSSSFSAAFAPGTSIVHHRSKSLLQSVSLDPKNNGYDSAVLVESNLAGNLGFDPLRLAQTKEQLITYRQAEIKHARLAMFAVLMWMWQDLDVVNTLGASPFFEDRVFPEFVGAAVGLPASLELYGMKKEAQNDAEYFPGNLGIDPFHLYPAEQEGQRRMQFAEVMMGRVCMIVAAVALIKGWLALMGFGDEELLSMLPTFFQQQAATTEQVLPVEQVIV